MALAQPKHETAFDALEKDSWNTNLIVHFNHGSQLEQFVTAPVAVDPGCSVDDILDKWRRLTMVVISDEQRKNIEWLVLGLESLKDVRDLSQALRVDVRSPI